MASTRACVDWFDWDIWIASEPGVGPGEFGSILLHKRKARR